jgi:cold shock CspA family protein
MQKQKGFINVWFENRGFGFIHANMDGNLKSYFFHISQLLSGAPMTGARAKFNVGANSKGEIATDVEILAENQAGVDALRSGEVRQ